MMMEKCVYCGHENAENAAACGECGTALASEGNPSLTSQPSVVSPARTVAEKKMLFGALWCGGGILVTGITYLAASGRGGTYAVAWGAILFGAFQFIQGYTARKAPHVPPSIDDSGYAALAYATQLETDGQIREAVAAYQKIAESYVNTPAGRDAQKSIDSLKAKLDP